MFRGCFEESVGDDARFCRTEGRGMELICEQSR